MSQVLVSAMRTWHYCPLATCRAGQIYAIQSGTKVKVLDMITEVARLRSKLFSLEKTDAKKSPEILAIMLLQVGHLTGTDCNTAACANKFRSTMCGVTESSICVMQRQT